MNWTTWNRHLYAAWAPFYDVLVAMLDDKRQRSLALADIQPDEKVLLLGAGTGLDLNYLPQQLHPTAIDITPAMIKRLRLRAQRLKMDVDARVMDGQSLAFDDGIFDVVILHFVLAVIPDPERALNEAVRVLRPGGRLVVLNKFLRDEHQPSLALRCANKLTRLLATDITYKLKPILQTPGLSCTHVEQVGLGGLFKIAILEKTDVATPSVDVATESVEVMPGNYIDQPARAAARSAGNYPKPAEAASAM